MPVPSNPIATDRFSAGIAAAAMTGEGIHIIAPPNPEQSMARATTHTLGARAVSPNPAIAITNPMRMMRSSLCRFAIAATAIVPSR